MKKSIFGITGIVGFFVLTAGIIVGTILVQQNQDFRERAAPSTSVYISPSTQTKNRGDTFTFKVNMDTGVNKVTGVDIRLNFDPNMVQIDSIQKGSEITALDTQINNTFDNQTGKISYAVFTVNKANAVSGSSVEILTVNGTIKSSASGNMSFSFNQLSTISGTNEGQNVIINSMPGNIFISSGGGTDPNPTATATATSLATSTATATSKVTATPTNQSQTPFPVPVTGVPWTTLIGAGFGIIVLFASLSVVF